MRAFISPTCFESPSLNCLISGWLVDMSASATEPSSCVAPMTPVGAQETELHPKGDARNRNVPHSDVVASCERTWVARGCVRVPHLALGAELSKRHDERSQLFSVNAMFGYFAGSAFAFTAWTMFQGERVRASDGALVPGKQCPDNRRCGVRSKRLM